MTLSAKQVTHSVMRFLMPAPNCAHAFSVSFSSWIESALALISLIIGITQLAKIYGSNPSSFLYVTLIDGAIVKPLTCDWFKLTLWKFTRFIGLKKVYAIVKFGCKINLLNLRLYASFKAVPAVTIA